MHGSIEFPVKSALLKVLSTRGFITFLSLTTKGVLKYIKYTIVTVQGFFELEMKNKWWKDIWYLTYENDTHQPIQEPNNNKTRTVFTKIVEISFIVTDQTWKFLIISRRGYKYIFLLHHYDFNAIIIGSLKCRKDLKFLRVYEKVIDDLQEKGAKLIV